MKNLFCFVFSFFYFSLYFSFAAEPSTEWTSREVARFPAVEANQGVAVDNEFFYAISNRQIGKYRKKDGQKVDEWKDSKNGGFIHINSGFTQDGKLICSHSNFPSVPMVSSAEIFDTAEMKHLSSHSFGIAYGSLTWIAERSGIRYACFANYAGKSGEPGHGSDYTQVVCFDSEWRNIGGYIFPKELVQKFNGSSASGGMFGPKGLLYITGHDAAEVYVLDFPKEGSVFRWLATIPVSFAGQAFSFDPSGEKILYGIDRKKKEVIVLEINYPR